MQRVYEPQYQAILELIPDAFIVQVGGKVALCNQAACHMFGANTPEDLIGVDAIELVDPDFRDFVLSRRSMVLSTEKPVPYIETRHRRLDGTSFPSEMVAGPIVMEGRPGTMNIIHDITERRRAEDALRLSEERFKDYAEAATDWAWETDASHRLMYFSKGQLELVDATLADALGKTPWEAVGADPETEESWRVHKEDLDARRPFRDFRVSFQVQSGRMHYRNISGKPVYDDAGLFLGYRGTATDVTDAVEAEHRAIDAQTRFLNALESISDGYALFDADDRLVHCNSTWRHEINAAVAEMIEPGVNFIDILRAHLKIGTISEAAGREDDWLHVRMERHRNPSERIDVRRVNEKWIQVYEERTLDGGTINIVSDITDRKLAETKLRESEERFRDMAESASDWFWEMGPDLRFTYHSERYFEMTGFRPEEKIGTTRTRYADPTDREADAEDWAAHMADLEAHRPFKNFEYTFTSSTGRVCHVRTSGTPIFDSDRKFLGYRGTGSDITERKQAEQALRDSRDRIRLITDNLPVAIAYFDSEQRFRFVNRTLERWYGRPAEEILGRTVGEILGPEAHKRIKIPLELTLAGEAQRTEHVVSYPDGETRTVDVVYLPHVDEPGTVQGCFALVQDITEHARTEQQIRQSQRMEAVGQLTAGVAHDFNNMLGVIWGNAELLADEVGKDEPHLTTLIRATRRGAELTQRLLAFSRKQVLHPKAINANGLIADITGLLRRTLEEHIDIQTVTAAGLWNCEVDPAQLENALVNLAINARDAMPDGGKLTIETANARIDDDYAAAQAEVRPGQYVMLAVTDTGTGMPAEVREHAFEPFYTTKAFGAGSGLGLSMVYGFVKQSGGHVSIYSEDDEGTTIRLYLPRSTETEAVEMKPATDDVPVAQGESVLVVEDDTDVRALAVELLGSFGYQVAEAATGPSALEQLASAPRVNLLLTDVVLPGGMNGRELAAEVARRAPGIKVLYMSGYTENAIVQHGRLDADAELLQKPFQRADIARAVRRVLDGPSA